MSSIETAHVISVAKSPTHTFSKVPCATINLIAGLGVEHDAHAGATVKHRSRVARDPSQPNLRQVHLMHVERFAELAAEGFTLKPGDIGENILTKGIDLLALPEDTEFHFASGAMLQIKGLRNPCHQLDDFMPGLMRAMLPKDASGKTILAGGIMAIVLASGEIRPGDDFQIVMPEPPYRTLRRV
ncbi:MAG: MOSC domain-containing protein [Pseudomonadota bacterium]